MLFRALAILSVLTLSIPKCASAQNGEETFTDTTSGKILIGIGAVCVIGAIVYTYFIKEYDPKYIKLKDEVKKNEREGKGDITTQIEILISAGEGMDREAAILEKENEYLKIETVKINEEITFLTELIAEDRRFIKPYRMAKYNSNLIKLNKTNPGLVAKIHSSITEPWDEMARVFIYRAYGAGKKSADRWEITKRVESGLMGGEFLVPGEAEPRFVSGAENLYDILMVSYGKYHLKSLWGCSASEVDEVINKVFPDIEE